MKKINVVFLAMMVLGLSMVFNACKKDETPTTPTITGEALFSFVADGKTVTFTNESTVSGTVTYAWDFGDGGTSTDKDPVYTYALKGEYNVTLTVKDSQGGTHPISTKVKVDKKTRISLTDNSLADWDAVTGAEYVVAVGDNSGGVVAAKFDYDADFVMLMSLLKEALMMFSKTTIYLIQIMIALPVLNHGYGLLQVPIF